MLPLNLTSRELLKSINDVLVVCIGRLSRFGFTKNHSHRYTHHPEGMSDETASSNTPSESSAEEHASLHTHPIPHRENPEAEVEIRKLKVKRKKSGSTFVEVTTNAHMKFSIRDLSELPSYQEFFSNADGFANSATPAMKYDFAFIFDEMRSRKIGISGGFDCAGRLLNIPNPRAYLSASDGFLFYCLDDVDTFGTVGSATGVIMPAIQAHIELPRADNQGRTVNDLRLHKDTLYLLRGHEQYTPRRHIKRSRILRQVDAFKSPRTHLNRVMISLCGLYYYFPSTLYTSTRIKVNNGRTCILRTALTTLTGALLVCEKHTASERVWYHENCSDNDCKTNGIMDSKRPATRVGIHELSASDCRNVLMSILRRLLTLYEHGHAGYKNVLYQELVP